MKCRTNALVLAVAPLFALALVSTERAFAQDLLTYSTGVRAQGMGGLGAADEADPANAFFNPAIISSGLGVFLTSNYATHTIEFPYMLDEGFHSYDIGAGYGLERPLRDDVQLKLGGGFTYNALRQSFLAHDQLHPSPTEYDYNESYFGLILGAGCKVGTKLHGGIGFAIKPWWQDKGYAESPTKHSKTAYDLGILAGVRIVDSREMRFSSTVGASFLNLGGSIGDYENLPKMYRYGLGLRYEGSAVGSSDNRFDMRASNVVVSVDYEIVDYRMGVYGPNMRSWGLGAELCLLQFLYFRTGYLHSNGYGSLNSSPYGVGIGYTSKWYWVRLDYAKVVPSGSDSHTDEYGLSLGLAY